MEQIGRYRILEEVGRGAMGVVYRAQDPAIGRVIAIKTIRLNDLHDTVERQRLRDRLFREAQSAGILSHPNIVTIYDISEENGLACIFMEFVDGPSLDRLLDGAHLPDRDTLLRIFRQTAVALDYAHRKGIVHRDIKPANLMIDSDGQTKIADFGVARVISHQMTQSGNMMGTPNYMSPEQVEGQPVDGRADQFALAVIAYEIMTGEKPFAAEYLPTLLYKIVREEPAAPLRLNPTLGIRIDGVLRRGLAKKPQDRFATCIDFVDALEQACRATPDWTPLVQGAAHTMPTMAEHAAPPAPAAPPVPEAVPASTPRVLPPRPAREVPASTGPAPDKNPLVRSAVWVLVGVGLVGLVLMGAQKFLFDPSVAPPVTASTETVPPGATPEPVKPSPMSPPQVVAPPVVKAPEAAKPEPERKSEPASEVAAPPKSTVGERSVQLLTDPPGASIQVDNDTSLVCTTPCLLKLSAGRHVLHPELEGYRPYPRVLNVPEETDVFLKLTKAVGTLSLLSNPPGATIQINGEVRPQRTPATFTLAPATYHIRVSRDGVPLDFEVQLKDGAFETRNVNFQ